jgi:lipid II:glycine glycyltransferase (peptidoglycan interpeptide bridge formation enzyme)
MMQDATFQIEVDASTPAEWSNLLDCFADANIYQSWSYGAARWGARNLSHLVLRQGGQVVAIAQVRIMRPTPLKVGMAYLRWGPLFHRKGQEPDIDIVLRMARALCEEYIGRRRLVLEILPNAFVDSPRAALFQSAFSGFEREPDPSTYGYKTLVLNLAPPLEELRSNLDKKWRNQLVRSEKNGLKVIAGTGAEEYGKFCRMYREMQKRKSFGSTVDIDEFGRIQESLPENHRMQTFLCEQNGVAVAGLIASAMGNTAIYLLGATSDRGLDAKGGYLLQWTLIEWLKKAGIGWYDLGGIDPEGNPGVYHFKKGLSGTEATHITPLVAHNGAVTYALFRAIMASRSAVRHSGAMRAAKTLLTGLTKPVRFVEERLFGRVS